MPTITITPERNPYRSRPQYRVTVGRTVTRCDTLEAAQAEGERLLTVVPADEVTSAPMTFCVEGAGRLMGR
jgi:hypothetical protein